MPGASLLCWGLLLLLSPPGTPGLAQFPSAEAPRKGDVFLHVSWPLARVPQNHAGWSDGGSFPMEHCRRKGESYKWASHSIYVKNIKEFFYILPDFAPVRI